MPLHEIMVLQDDQNGYHDIEVPVTKGLDEPLDLIEYAGRWDYGSRSIDKMGDPDIIRRWIEGGEESMVEMVDATFLIECSRVVTHELVRHRIASYQQESQRFVKYDEEDPDDLFYVPDEIVMAGEDAEKLYRLHVGTALATYNALKRQGVKSQIARYVLPNATRTRIIVKMNLREWRHVLRLRLHTSAQPEMREVMKQVHRALNTQFGSVLFPENLGEDRAAR